MRRPTMKSDSKSMTREDRLESFQRRQQTIPHGFQNGAIRPFWSAKRRNRSVTFDISSVGEDPENNNDKTVKFLASSYRRMSAPELPPISARDKNSPTQLILQGNTRFSNRVSSARSNSNSARFSNHRSNTSDGSMRGKLAKSPQSGDSSSSSQQGRINNNNNINKLSSDGQLNRGKTWCVPEQTLSGLRSGSNNIKLESIDNNYKRGMSVAQTPRSTTKNGYRSRISSKDYSAASSGNNNSPPKKQLTHCKSDSKIVPIEEIKRTKTFVKRSSVQKFKSENSQKQLSVEKTDTLTKGKTTGGNVNGMRRYSSSFAINSQIRSEDSRTDEFDDSDSDSSKDQYIINWIIGVENEETEVPPDPEIEYIEHPPQTDTAVHIVYED